MNNFQRRRKKSLHPPPEIFTGDRILIVCEDSKSAPAYFEYLRRTWKISVAQIEIAGGASGSDPVSVVKFAVKKKNENKKESRRQRASKFDQVWCVVDKDQHPNLNQALSFARQNRINVALSVPCFELWLLLHYTGSIKPFNTFDELNRGALKKHIPEYNKSNIPHAELLDLLEDAKENAEKLRARNVATNSSNPSTDIDLIVIELENCKP